MTLFHQSNESMIAISFEFIRLNFWIDIILVDHSMNTIYTIFVWQVFKSCRYINNYKTGAVVCNPLGQPKHNWQCRSVLFYMILKVWDGRTDTNQVWITIGHVWVGLIRPLTLLQKSNVLRYSLENKCNSYKKFVTSLCYVKGLGLMDQLNEPGVCFENCMTALEKLGWPNYDWYGKTIFFFAPQRKIWLFLISAVKLKFMILAFLQNKYFH